MTIYPQTLGKQPNEVVTRSADFTPALIPGRTLTSCLPPVVTVKKQNPSNTASANDLDIGGVIISGNQAQVQIDGGLDKATYKLTFRGTDSGGDIIEVEGLLAVKET